MPSTIISEKSDKLTAASRESSSSTRRVLLLIFAVFTALALFFQWAEGAFQSEFGGHPDEAAHYVTGLLVRDTLVFAKSFVFSGFHGSPAKVGKDFVQSYYDHYPKIGLGVWPPLFYLVQSTWTLLFGTSRGAVLVLMAVLSGLVGTVLFSALRKEHGPILAGFGGLAWLGLPLVQQYSGMTMAEMLSALLMFGAALRCGRYIDERRKGDAYWFGLLASAAILTKGTGLALAFVPVLALVATRRFSLLKERALWIGGVIVVILAGPWTFATRKLGEGGWEEAHPSLNFTLKALPYYGWKVCVAIGILLGALAVVGLAVRLVRFFRDDEPENGKWACALALIFGVLVFQSIAPVGREARHMIPLLPAVLMLSVAGLGAVVHWSRRLAGQSQSLEWAVCGGLMLALIAIPTLKGGPIPPYGSIGDVVRLSPFRICPKPSGGFGPVVKEILNRSDKNKVGGVFMVSSDSSGEGMFIAEVAIREKRRPMHFAKRASKELAASSWSGGDYKPKFDSDGALLAWLTGGTVDYLVLDTAIPQRNRKPHHEMLRRVVESHPEQFEKVAAHPLVRGFDDTPGEVRAYRIHRS